MNKNSKRLTPNMQNMTKLFIGKKYEECLKFIDAALSASEDTTQLRILQAGCWTQLDTNQLEAEQQLNEVIRAEPNNAFAYYGLGLNFYRRGELQKCLDPFTTASKLNSATMSHATNFKSFATKILSLFNDATAEFNAGRCLKAFELLSLAVLVDPENDAIKRIVKQQTNKFLQKVVLGLEDEVLANDDVNMVLNHVEYLVNSKKFEAAEKIVPDDELLSDARGFFLKGIVKYMMGSLKISLVYIKKALEIDETMQRAKDLEEKAEKFVELIEGASEKMKQNENEDAIAMLSSALEVDGENKRIIQAIYFQRAVAKFNFGQQREAFEDYLLFESLQNITGLIMDGIKF